jgi:pimeloyl-ACP methyl ester carboxylesterase
MMPSSLSSRAVRGDTTEIRISAHGVEFVCLSRGSGPLVLLVHGFPDIPLSWAAQIDALSEAGYQVVAPYLPGYVAATECAPAYYDKASLVHYFAGLIKALSPDKKITYIGQDWGAIIGYGLCAARPDLIDQAILMAVPHPEIVSKHLLVPKHIHRSFHWWFFQQESFPEQAIMANDLEFIDYLWEYWTVKGYRDEDHIRAIKHCLKQPGVLTNALAYYRAMFDHAHADPALQSLRSQLTNKIFIPTLALCGTDDMRAELMREQSDYFGADYEYREIPHSGHFLHREQSQQVNTAILKWLSEAS